MPQMQKRKPRFAGGYPRDRFFDVCSYGFW